MASQGTRQIRQIIGHNIRDARRRCGFTQRQLAASLDTDGFQVSRWERGLHRPSDGMLVALADALDVELAYFYADRGADAPPLEGFDAAAGSAA